MRFCQIVLGIVALCPQVSAQTSLVPELSLISLEYSASNPAPIGAILIAVRNAAGPSAPPLSFTVRPSVTNQNWLRVAVVSSSADTSDACPQDVASYAAYPATLNATTNNKLCITAAHSVSVSGNYSGFLTLTPLGGTPAEVIVNLRVDPSGFLLLTPDLGTAFNENILTFGPSITPSYVQTVKVEIADPSSGARINAPISYSLRPDANPLDWLSVQCVLQDRATPCGSNPVTPVYFRFSAVAAASGGQLVAKIDIASVNPSCPGNDVITILANLPGGQTATNSISGQVTLAGSGGLAGVLISLNNGASTTTDTSGTYAFNNLTAGANYTVTPSRSGYTFSPSSASVGALSGNQTASFTAAAASANSLSDAAFITRLYQSILGRSPDAAGLSYWQAKLNGGETRGAVADEFLRSPEYASIGLFIVSNYLGVLGREPELAGYQYWFAQMRVQGKQQIDVINGFLASPEYVTRFGNPDNPTFVTELYANVLGRAPDPAGFQYWTNFLNTGQMSRPQVVQGFIGSPEFQVTTLNQLYVNLAYFALLNRAPTPAELTSGKQAIAAGQSTASFLNGIVASPEFLALP